MIALIAALCITIIIEMVVAMLLGLRNPKDYLLLVVVNMLTNPAINSLYHYVFNGQGGLGLELVLEMGVVLVEGFLFKRLEEIHHPWFFALLINLASYGVGILVQ